MLALGIAPKQIAKLAQKAENNFIGVQCGIMDQFISALGRKDAALLIDCRSLDSRPVPLRLEEKGMAIVITNSGVKRGLVDSEYNTRREQCTEAVQLLSKKLKRELKALRDVEPAEFKKHEKALPELVAKRARHVITENERVLASVEALGKGDMKAFGKLMNASHDSMRDDFEITTPEIDQLVAATQKHPGVVGARMTGGGFGGCTVALMSTEAIATYRSDVIPAYEKATGCKTEVFVCDAAPGASVLHSPMLALGLR
jgi:galactokinase